MNTRGPKCTNSRPNTSSAKPLDTISTPAKSITMHAWSLTRVSIVRRILAPPCLDPRSRCASSFRLNTISSEPRSCFRSLLTTSIMRGSPTTVLTDRSRSPFEATGQVVVPIPDNPQINNPAGALRRVRRGPIAGHRRPAGRARSMREEPVCAGSVRIQLGMAARNSSSSLAASSSLADTVGHMVVSWSCLLS